MRRYSLFQLLLLLVLCQPLASALGQVQHVRRDSLSRAGEYNETVLHAYLQAAHDYVEAMKRDATSGPLDTFWLDYSRAENVLFYLGDYPQALRWATHALDLAVHHQDGRRIALALNTLGFIYFHQKRPEAALVYFKRYLEQSRRIADTNLILDAINNAAELRINQGQERQALDALQEGVAWYGSKATHSVTSYSTFLESQALARLDSTTEARKLIGSLVTDPDSTQQNLYDRVRYLVQASRVEQQGDRSLALSYAQRAQALARRIGHVEDMEAADQTLADVYRMQHRYDSAYHYATLASAIRDSILLQRNNQWIEELHTEQNLDRQNRSILLQKSQLERQVGQRTFFIWVIALLLVVLGLALLLLRLRQKTVFQRNLNRHQSEMYRLVMDRQEADRMRMAQDLHDGIGSLLSASRMQLTTAQEAPSNHSINQYQKGLELLDEAAGQLRVLAQQTMPSSLKREGLVEALRGILESISLHQHWDLEFQTYGMEIRLSEAVELNLYRVVMELVHNVQKHANARRLSIQLIRHQAKVTITVEDDGIGMPVSLGRHAGMGLDNVQARVFLMRGTWHIDSLPDHGTTVILEIPLNERS